MNIQKTTLGIAGVVIAGISFFAGVKYDQGKTPSLAIGNQGFSVQGAQIRGGIPGSNGAQRGARVMNGGAVGSIVAKDATSITVALRGGGSKIVFLSPKTAITKTTDGVAGELSIGKEVSVSGIPNSDGSIVAQSIQLRPNFSTSTAQ
ncbi:hypothetical protein AUJ77_02950 [Candidatus Nomurabacteria bacterium CG1_02_43_90]|uniref:DUF5666 domain-containing protein n=1 Tax=Candidatus Nomurabacteria bacterium CG1_02_43_90 TaxID=1805281 RepID=A0A1J4V3E8_9BACT|nr:MAG: hypothetical protein AUJ77_02950 [Candidatus Nomurabacteria bacterium CG1_02_43_90]